MNRALAVAGLVTLAATITGCGPSGDPDPTPAPVASATTAPSATPAAHHDESEVIEFLKLDNDLTYRSGNLTCDIAVVLTSRAMAQMYIAAGDNVATNPGGDVGVKIVDLNGVKCNTAITESLSTFGTDG